MNKTTILNLIRHFRQRCKPKLNNDANLNSLNSEKWNKTVKKYRAIPKFYDFISMYFDLLRINWIFSLNREILNFIQYSKFVLNQCLTNDWNINVRLFQGLFHVHVHNDNSHMNHCQFWIRHLLTCNRMRLRNQEISVSMKLCTFFVD